MAAKLSKTSTPGIFRRHGKDCTGGRCECAYVVVWRYRGQQQTATVRTFAEAREVKAEREAGDRRPTSRVRVGDYFAEWIESYAGRTARGFSETTRPEYRRPIDAHALPKWRTWRLADVEPADVRDLFGYMRKAGASTSQIKKLRAALSAMFATAVEDGVIRTNPITGVRIPAGPEPEASDEKAKALTRSELALLLAAVPQGSVLLFEFMAHTGMRIGETVGLTWANLELGERPRVKVREQVYEGKRRKLKSRDGRRDIPLSAGMVERLRAHRRDTYAGADAPVFPSKAGTPLRPSNLHRRALQPAREAAGLPWATFHTLRHTCASLLFAEGRNVKQVQEWLGHADPGFTLRTYVHLMDEGVGDAEFLDVAVTADPAQVNAGSTPGQQHARKQVETPETSERRK